LLRYARLPGGADRRQDSKRDDAHDDCRPGEPAHRAAVEAPNGVSGVDASNLF
jgi:hypothetical protein